MTQANDTPPITVFTKPWKDLEISALADLIAELGFDGIELPVRPGFQVEPDTIEETLGHAVDVFKACGLTIYSVAGDMDVKTARACAQAGVPVLRTMLKITPEKSYQEHVEEFRTLCLELGEALAGSATTIGLQNHCDEFVTSSIGMMHAIEGLPNEEVTAVLDLGHTGLDGEVEEIAIDIAWSRLSLVNLKNAIRYPDGKDDFGATIWNRTWVPGREGYTSWNKAIAELGRRSYSLPICITCEYKDEARKGLSGNDVILHLKDDLKFLKELIDQHY
ncbi:sugar phosphate isomerase/epimerase [Opitutia bacterium ISCC 51]|nr:sugar phosphate isomerase/epimerase [Opitutae bacterium ISCC 51]QXD26911.1 sugar phosphate isomerase/epimerase [Opitutae bacterium ISCC 52]